MPVVGVTAFVRPSLSAKERRYAVGVTPTSRVTWCRNRVALPKPQLAAIAAMDCRFCKALSTAEWRNLQTARDRTEWE